jgi:hypothetical protein
LELDPAGGDVDRAEGVEVEAPGRRATVGHQVQFEEARLSVAPLGEGADRDLVLELGAGAGGGRAPPRERGPERGQQARQRGGADLAEVFVHLGAVIVRTVEGLTEGSEGQGGSPTEMRRPCPGPGPRLASARLMGVAFSRAGGVPRPSQRPPAGR